MSVFILVILYYDKISIQRTINCTRKWKHKTYIKEPDWKDYKLGDGERVKENIYWCQNHKNPMLSNDSKLILMSKDSNETTMH